MIDRDSNAGPVLAGFSVWGVIIYFFGWWTLLIFAGLLLLCYALHLLLEIDNDCDCFLRKFHVKIYNSRFYPILQNISKI